MGSLIDYVKRKKAQATNLVSHMRIRRTDVAKATTRRILCHLLHPEMRRSKIAKILNCSESLVSRNIQRSLTDAEEECLGKLMSMES